MRWMWLVMLAACVDGTAKDPACEDVAPEDCAATEGCAAITGRLLRTDTTPDPCVDFTDPGEPLACMSADGGCGDAETLAAPPDDPSACTWFSSTCIPAGWVSCGDVADECTP